MLNMSTTLLTTVLFSTTLYVCIKLWRHFNYWKSRGIQSKLIVFDVMRKTFPKFLFDLNHGMGRVFGANNISQNLLVVNDAELYRELCIKEAHLFPLRAGFHIGRNNLTKALFFMEANEDWKRIRSIVSPAFTSGKLRAMCAPIENVTDKLIVNLRPYAQNKQELDIKLVLEAFTMDVISRCAYGIELDSLSQPNHPVIVNAKRILNVNASLQSLVCFMFPRIAKFLALNYFDTDSIRFFDKLTYEIVNKRIENSSSKDDKFSTDLIGLMLRELDSEQSGKTLKGITKDEISGQGILFYIAGQDTTNSTFNSVVYYLALHPEWQERIFSEIKELNGNLSYDRIKEAILLEAFINETLRLCPPLGIISRVAKEDCTIGRSGIQVEKGTYVMTHPFIIHRDSEYFPQPEQFRPERFLNKESGTQNCFFPFGYGNRLCVGMRFAQNELRLGIAKLVLNYRIAKTSNTKLEYFIGSPLLTPKNMFVKLSERS